MIVTILLVVAMLSVLVFVHELGHFLEARRAGIDVEEFGFGFPPRVFGRQVGRTLYSINLFPLGGFVRLKGESGDEAGPGSFTSARFKDKTKVLLAGVGMNLALAYLVLVGLCLTGLPPVLDNQFNFGNPTYSQPRQLIAAEVVKGSPAETAGLKEGDYVLSGNGVVFEQPQQLADFTKAHAGQTVNLTIRHGSEERQVTAKLHDAANKDGYLGVLPVQFYKLHYDLLHAPVVAAGILVQIFWATLSGLGHFLLSIPALFGGLFARKVVATEATGPIGIIYFLGHLRSFGLSPLLLIFMNISVALAVFNVLPLPALDGGRWALLAWQKLTGRKLDPSLENRIHTYGFLALILIALLVTANDIKRF
ncbi:MAG TPA: M50 family metallopeptidase [Candidatus Nanoarchaeia archaeon]|nr:M50 family metallopeptidase [Candidatus Nanoarchaeia archaeon]